MKRKISVRLSEEIVERLEAAAQRPGANKTTILEAALDRFLDPGVETIGDATLLRRLDGMSRQLEQLEHGLKIVNETVALHARYHLAIMPPLPQSQQRAACALGLERFEEFAAQVGRRVRLGMQLMRETMDRLSTGGPHLLARTIREDRRAPQMPGPTKASLHQPSWTNRKGCLLPLGRTAAAVAFQGTDTIHRGDVAPGATNCSAEAVLAPPVPTPVWGPTPRRSARYPTQNGRLIATVFLPFAAGYYLSYLFRSLNAPISAHLTSDLALGAADLGLLTSVYFLTFAAAQIPIGVLLDRYGPRRIQSALLLVAAAGAVLFGMAETFVGLVLARAMIGLGVAAALMASLKAIVLWFPRERVALINSYMIMLGTLGAVTATAPIEHLLDWIGWRGLFELLAAVTAACAVVIYFVVPEPVSVPSSPQGSRPANLKAVFADPRFWRLAPLSATCVGSAWALQGLWAAPWLTDVEGLDRASLITRLFMMAVALSFGALLLGTVADRMRRRGMTPHALLLMVAIVFVAAQFALILRLPVPSSISWSIVSAVGASTALSYAIIADYFPQELAGRANAALNVFHLGWAFLFQWSTGLILEQWPCQDGHYPLIAYQVAFGLNVALQIAALICFEAHRVRTFGSALTSEPGRFFFACRTALEPVTRYGC
jgi:MFS family permease/predicted DNA-binding protein